MHAHSDTTHTGVTPQRGGNRLRRIRSLVRKETYQILRDPSSILIAFVLPVVLLFLFGYGVSLDLRDIDIAVVVEHPSTAANSLVHTFQSSTYFNLTLSQDRREVEPLLIGGRLSAVVVIPSDFAERIQRGEEAPLQALVGATDANTGELVLGYIEGAWQNWLVQYNLSRGEGPAPRPIDVEARIWFNEAADSRFTLLPGSIAVIMTLIGTMLTSLVVAREWERGTMEALLATPVSRSDLLLGKFIPYFVLGMLAIGMVTAISTFVMGVPFRGSFVMLAVVSAVFLSFALGLGLLISTVTRNQFVATQLALIVGFLPSFLLSGLVFEIDSMPTPIRWFTTIIVPKYYVSSLRTLFLAGDVWSVLIPDILIMAAFSAFFLTLVHRLTKIRVD